ncbi:hypothetical protein VIBRN418_08667 [Vibrio sp. N418]|nr:hypothetical protein [Vibrio sp. N418]EGU36046.1 hypothetical protein VIBRN418_08667 [Vibrio sp. N418]
MLVSIFIFTVSSEQIIGIYNLLVGIFFLFFYVFSFWGGGDTKLAIAFLPAISSQYALLFLIGIGLLGGVLLSVYLIAGLRRGFDEIKKGGLPFGIPICISGLLCVAASL